MADKLSKQLANVFQAARLLVDEVLTFAAAIHAAADVHLGIAERVLGGLPGAGLAGVEDPVVGLVGAHLSVDERGALGQGGLHVQDDRQLLVLHLDRLQGVLGGVAVPGHDDGHGLAAEVHLVIRTFPQRTHERRAELIA